MSLRRIARDTRRHSLLMAVRPIVSSVTKDAALCCLLDKHASSKLSLRNPLINKSELSLGLVSRYYWTVDNANLLRFTRRSYHLD